jgi:hypothetical protein
MQTEINKTRKTENGKRTLLGNSAVFIPNKLRARNLEHDINTKVYRKISGLASRSENCK